MMFSIIIHSNTNRDNILDNYPINNPNIEVLIECENSISESFNVGLNKAKGDFVWFLTENDTIETNLYHLEECFLNCNEDVFTFDYSYVYSDGCKEYNYANSYNAPADCFIPMILQNRYTSSLCNKIFRRTLLINNDMYFHNELNFFFDKLFLLTLYKISSVRTKYNNINVVTHTVDVSRNELHQTLYPIHKECIDEYYKYYMHVKSLLGNKYNEMIEQDTLEFKRNLCILGYLGWNKFNSFCKTPLHLIWKPIFTIRQSLRLTINYFKYLL